MRIETNVALHHSKRRAQHELIVREDEDFLLEMELRPPERRDRNSVHKKGNE